ncbi:MAG: SDR family oxidoreductase [Rhizomicrobium sp.]
MSETSILDSFRLDGRVAVVTGAGGGIGSAAARAFAQAGADVALVARDRAKLERAAQAVTGAGRRAVIVEADVTDEAAVNLVAEKVQAGFGRADILFNNAGVTAPKLMTELSVEEWRRIVDVNVTGAFLCARAFVPVMARNKYGRVINMGSVLSGRGMANRTPYCASKAALANFGASLAFEVAGDGITVNTLGATVIVTDLNRDLIRLQPDLYDGIKRRIAVGRLGEVGDLLGALVFLASPASAFMTGQTLYVDGGYTAG